jgi:hypothetical protein
MTIEVSKSRPHNPAVERAEAAKAVVQPLTFDRLGGSLGRRVPKM